MRQASGIEGMREVTKKMDRAQRNIAKAILIAMDHSLRDTVNYIKTDYADSRAKTGKGFTSKTHNLQNSIGHKQGIEKDEVVGYVHAGWGPEDYAGHVEMRWEGKYAYLWPGVNDKGKEIKKTIADDIKAVIK